MKGKGTIDWKDGFPQAFIGQGKISYWRKVLKEAHSLLTTHQFELGFV
jgi:hypothetical protein